MTAKEIREQLIELNIAEDQEIDLVCNINGFNEETLNDILYARTGYRSLEQYYGA